MKQTSRYMLSIALLWCASCPLCDRSAFAEFIVEVTDTVAPQSIDEWKYTYAVANQSNDGEHIFALYLNFGIDVAISNIATPNGWEVYYQEGDTYLTWFTESPVNDILPGNTANFEFFANAGPGSYDATVDGEARNGELVGSSIAIQAPGPQVPEPSASTLALIGGALASVWKYLRRLLP